MSTFQRLCRSSKGLHAGRVPRPNRLPLQASGAALVLGSGLVIARPLVAEDGTRAVVAELRAVASPSGERPGKIDTDAVRRALERAAALVLKCKPHAGVSGEGRVRVRYERSGHVESVQMLTPKFQNGPTGACVRMLFLRANVPPFNGRSQEFEHPFLVPG